MLPVTHLLQCWKFGYPMKPRCYIRSKPLSKLSKEERRYLNYLTLKGESYMRIDVLRQRENLEDYQIFIAKISNSIVGWAVIFPEKYALDRSTKSKAYCLYAYVKYRNRRQKVGSKLLRHALRWSARRRIKVNVFPWDTRSDNFYDKNDVGKYSICEF
jgi:GNAT superfamily N-acetyltransferase